MNMKEFLVYTVIVLIYSFENTNVSASPRKNGHETELHFGFQTENGQFRTEDIKYNNTVTEEENTHSQVSDLSASELYGKPSAEVKPVEYRGGYSFISADGYEYTVVYKANSKGFQPYVTARKIIKT